ncbi:hypothetical protein [Streptomyces sp. NPDC006997]|uniref:hypothetical protein n=1 Tax=Streptomyces sp. NPDC006997 TaxID=3155356 RepID=UPI0033D3B267
MIKNLARVSVLAAALLATAVPAAQATVPAAPPAPSAGVPGASFLDSVLGSLELGHPASSPQSLLPTGVLGG